MKLQAFRVSIKMQTREQAAAHFGVDPATIWRWETGRCIPKPEQIQAVKEWSDGLVTANDFHHGEGK
jgi:transcriptional regulator with XRE-family HTH domain